MLLTVCISISTWGEERLFFVGSSIGYLVIIYAGNIMYDTDASKMGGLL